MIWEYATAIPAEMAEYQTFGNRADKNLVENSMCLSSPVTYYNLAIATDIRAAYPLPTDSSNVYHFSQ